MEILVAKSAGFCFGVQKAVSKAEDMSREASNVYTFGPIIHNSQVVNDLKNKGVDVINNLEDAKEGHRIIIRSHGIPKGDYDRLKEAKAEVIDATCPYVQHIHKIVEEKFNAGYKIIIVGDPEHPEVKGVNGWCENTGVIINNVNDINEDVKKFTKICIVAQTTYKIDKWNSIVCELIKFPKEILIFNTICNATETRQQEAFELSKKVDAMIVIGGKDSSNTRKLYEICLENCEKTIFIENAEELDVRILEGAHTVGITAGASTPEYAIKGVVEKLSGTSDYNSEVNKDNNKAGKVSEKTMDIEKDPYEMSFKEIYPGIIIKGTVILVSQKELFVDLGYKSDGILPVEEVLNHGGNLKEIFKVGDEIEVEVIKMNDGEGNVLLSRKEVEKKEFIEKLQDVKNEGKEIEVTVVNSNKGGFECKFEDLKAFMPLSLSGLQRGENTDSLVGKRVKAVIADIKEKRGDVEVVVSRKEIVAKERHRKAAAFIETLEEGQKHSGFIKSIIKAGIFVTVNEIDVFVPISEIAWRRIDNPADVVSEGQKVEISIMKVDRENLKVTGSIKKAGKEPWERFVEEHKEDEVIEGKVARFTDFGAFIEIMEGLDGLVHISNISERRINKPQDMLKLGQTVRVKIVKIDKENKRVGLSIKDVE